MKELAHESACPDLLAGCLQVKSSVGPVILSASAMATDLVLERSVPSYHPTLSMSVWLPSLEYVRPFMYVQTVF